uniref:Uncharacterized protein n=1 Tax=Euplotes harpa TaxID=151035 RepID=A0A7S3JPZ4_9SPIT|mmetsp:Transcript_9279/g.10443  ORF Transcript_9279/g.10443 Transcript_9279/m.10443 type:complete len:192 (+) Transcript_9279:20-595(+)
MELDALTEFINTLPDFGEEVELFHAECKKCKLNITDFRIIMTKAPDSDDEEYCFIINNIEWIAYIAKMSCKFMIRVKDDCAYTISTKKRSDAIAVISLLYTKLNGTSLPIYSLSKEDFKKLQISRPKKSKVEKVVKPEEKFRIRTNPDESLEESSYGPEKRIEDLKDQKSLEKVLSRIKDSGIENGNELFK